MAETFKSILFVFVSVMVALIIQAHAGNLTPEHGHSVEDDSIEQIHVYN